MHDRAVFLIPNPWVKADIKTGTPDTSHTRADYRGCCVVKPCLLPTIYSQPSSLTIRARVGSDDCTAPAEGTVAMPAKAKGYRKQDRPQLSKSGGLCSVPKTASYQPAASLALIPLMLTVDKPVVPLTCLLAPKIQHMNNSRAL